MNIDPDAGAAVFLGAVVYFVLLVQLAVFLPAVQYLFGEAVVFERLRAKLPPFFKLMFACPSCFGFWAGVVTGAVGWGPWAVGATPWAADTVWGAAGMTGLAAVAITPVGRSLMALGWAIASDAYDNAAHDHDHDHHHEHAGDHGDEEPHGPGEEEKEAEEAA